MFASNAKDGSDSHKNHDGQFWPGIFIFPDSAKNSNLGSTIEPVVDFNLFDPETRKSDEHSGDKAKEKANDSQSMPLLSPSKSDKGYESDLHEKTFVIHNLPTPHRFQMTHEIQTFKKTQHFSKVFTVSAHSGGQETGIASARYVDRSLINKSNFYKSMEELNSCNSDGLAFAETLFSYKGTLINRHKSDKHKYAGPWGHELETGGVLILRYLLVEKQFRRRGLGHLLLDELILKTQERTGKKPKGIVKFMVVFPDVIKPDFEEELQGKTEGEKKRIGMKAYENAVKFYRAYGFRRIGFSKWFGYALDPDHKSRQIAFEGDLDPPSAF